MPAGFWRFVLFLGLSAALWQLLPDRFMGPYNALNPHAITEFVVTVLCISGVGHLCARLLGSRLGLVVTGFVGGFASSTATIYSMGSIARRAPHLHHSAVLGALLSNVATLLQLLLLVRLLAAPMAPLVWPPITTGLLAMLAVSAWTHFSGTRDAGGTVEAQQNRRADLVQWKSLLTLTALVSGITWLSAVLFTELGAQSLPIVAATSGLVDAHAIIPSLGALVGQGQLTAAQAMPALLVAFTVNAVSKSVIAFQAGGPRFGGPVLGGLSITAAGLWLGLVT